MRSQVVMMGEGGAELELTIEFGWNGSLAVLGQGGQTWCLLEDKVGSGSGPGLQSGVGLALALGLFAPGELSRGSCQGSCKMACEGGGIGHVTLRPVKAPVRWRLCSGGYGYVPLGLLSWLL